MVGMIYTLVATLCPNALRFAQRRLFAQPPRVCGPWPYAAASPSSPSPWVWQKSRPFDGPFERECLQRFTEFDAATPPTRRIMRLAIPPSEEVWRAGEHPQRGAARGGHGRRRAA